MRLLLKNLLFVLIVPGTVGVYVPLLFARHRHLASGWLFVAGWIALGLGFGCLVWCVWSFAAIGRGTPAPVDAPRSLVVRGLYRYSRNPMYAGVLTMIGAWAALFADWRLLVYMAVIAMMFNAFIILYEEPRLAKLFGDEYARYKERVGRWLPRVSRRE